MKRTIPLILGALAVALFSVSASAQKRPDYGTPINLAGAKKIAAATIAACTSKEWNVAVAVVDNHGALIYFERMDNTQIGSIKVAQIKASSAAIYRRPSAAFAKAIKGGRVAIVTLPGIFASPGGLPIVKGGKVIGAVGVSGDTSCADHNIAWRTRNNLALDYVPAGVSGDPTRPDNIVFDVVSQAGQMPGVSASGWGHPNCIDSAVENPIAATLPVVQ